MFTKFIDKANEVVKQANEMFNLNMRVTVKVDIRGNRIAGQVRRDFLGNLILRLNPKFCAEYEEETLNDTIPHEVAHLVCYALGLNKEGHGKRWQAISIKLGCNGKRCHNMKLSSSARYFVKLDGVDVEMTKGQYTKAKKGVSQYKHKSGAIINSNCEFFIKIGDDKKETPVEKEVKAPVKDTIKTEVKTGIKKSNMKNPAKISLQIFFNVNKDFTEFKKALNGKTDAYINDQFERCVFVS